MIHQSRLILHLSRPVDAGKLRAKPIRDVGRPSAAALARLIHLLRDGQLFLPYSPSSRHRPTMRCMGVEETAFPQPQG